MHPRFCLAFLLTSATACLGSCAVLPPEPALMSCRPCADRRGTNATGFRPLTRIASRLLHIRLRVDSRFCYVQCKADGRPDRDLQRRDRLRIRQDAKRHTPVLLTNNVRACAGICIRKPDLQCWAMRLLSEPVPRRSDAGRDASIRASSAIRSHVSDTCT